MLRSGRRLLQLRQDQRAVFVNRTSQQASAEDETANPILRDPAEQEVSPLELLFDLVFVLGVSQLTRHLVTKPTWRGAAETLVLYLPMFAVWMYTSWAATIYSLGHPRAGAAWSSR